MALFVLALVTVFVRLGLWQLDRREERAIENLVMAGRMAEAPVEIMVALSAAGEDLAGLEYRRVSATGSYRPDLEKLIRNRTNRFGTAGFHLLTPLELGDGSLIIVNRGWIPLDADTVPSRYPPVTGQVTLTGFVRPSEVRHATGTIEPSGSLDVFNRIDLERIGEEFDQPIRPVWIQLPPEDGREIPQPLEVPDTADPGPHLSYAVQWFSFALIAMVGFGVALSRADKPRRRHLPPIE